MRLWLSLKPSRRWLACLGSLLIAVAACQSPPLQAQGPAWQLVDLPGMPSGGRAATYDVSRDCLWIVSRVSPETAGSQEIVKLLRLNVSDRKVVETPVVLSATGFIEAWVVLDAKNKVWMAWGKSLFEYDPDSGSINTYVLPSFASLGVQVHLYQDGMDGNIVGLVIDSTGEIWVAAYKVAGVFGFNPARSSWDRTVRLPWFSYDLTRLAAPQPGVLTINGFRSPDGKVFKHLFAKVETSTSRVIQLPLEVYEYSLIDNSNVLYTDSAGDIGSFNLNSGTATIVAPHAPANMSPGLFVPDGNGHVWFSMISYRNIGIAELTLATKTVTQFPFPYIRSPGQHVTEEWSCAGMPTCIPLVGAVFDAGVQAIFSRQTRPCLGCNQGR